MSKRKNLTPRQHDTLHYIRIYTAKQKWPPTIRELCFLLGVSSTATVMQHIRQLEAKGYIKRGLGARQLHIVR